MQNTDNEPEYTMNWKAALPILLALLLILFTFVKFVVPVLDKGDYRPSSVIREVENGEGIYDFGR